MADRLANYGRGSSVMVRLTVGGEPRLGPSYSLFCLRDSVTLMGGPVGVVSLTGGGR